MFFFINSFPSPTPTINWFKRGGDLPAKKVKLENFNKTLRILDVSEEDSGGYICMASNKIGSIRHSVEVQVKGGHYREKAPDASCSWHICSFFYLTSAISLLPWKAAPYWLDKPTNLVLAPDENGRLVCRANGNPKPTIQWLVNGEPIESESAVFLVLTLGIIIHKAGMHTFFCSLCNSFTTKPKPASSWWHHHVPFGPDRRQRSVPV